MARNSTYVPRKRPNFRTLFQPYVAVENVASYTYVGVLFTVKSMSLFESHLEGHLKSARKIYDAIFATKAYIGGLKPAAARKLYTGRVDPHLTNGAEVAISSKRIIDKLAQVQREYLRRMLSLNPRSVSVPLYTETGLYPVTPRRAGADLNYMAYVLDKRPSLPLAAMVESQAMALDGHNSWINDLHLYLSKIAPDLKFELGGPQLTVAHADGSLKKLRNSLNRTLRDSAMEMTRIPLITARFDKRGPSATALAMRPYLMEVGNADDRKAITKLITGDHPLAIETLRRLPSNAAVRREWRVCRFCRLRDAIEAEGHILLDCKSNVMTSLRTQFHWRAREIDDSFETPQASTEPYTTITKLLHRTVFLPSLARFVREIFDVCETTPSSA